jgi:hypothetical protein
MANIPAQGSAPVSFVDTYGNQYSIPLPWVSYPSQTGTPTVAASWPGWAAPLAQAQQAAVAASLTGLATQGLITAPLVPAALPSIVITAQTPGLIGNDISVTFNSVNPDGSLNVTVSTTQKYPGLTYATGQPNYIETVLGSSTPAPGLAYVDTPPAGLPTATSAPVAFTQPSSPPNSPYQFELPGTNGILFASNNPTSSDAGLITAAIANVDTTAETFDLTLAWSKTSPASPPPR